jgi:hypothetical protein
MNRKNEWLCEDIYKNLVAAAKQVGCDALIKLY